MWTEFFHLHMLQGYGAKLTNIYSKSFIVETADSSREKRYRPLGASLGRCRVALSFVAIRQVWHQNMTSRALGRDQRCFGVSNWLEPVQHIVSL